MQLNREYFKSLVDAKEKRQLEAKEKERIRREKAEAKKAKK